MFGLIYFLGYILAALFLCYSFYEIKKYFTVGMLLMALFSALGSWLTLIVCGITYGIETGVFSKIFDTTLYGKNPRDDY